ncbi:hypothetical protein [Nonomuraea sp. NPDC049625]
MMFIPLALLERGAPSWAPGSPTAAAYLASTAANGLLHGCNNESRRQ